MKKLNLILISILTIAAAGTLPAQTVTVNPTSLSFSAQVGGAAQSQPLAVTNNSGSTGVGAIATGAVGSNIWLKVNGSTSIEMPVPATLTVTADPTGLAAGNYTGTLMLFGISSVGQLGPQMTVQVTFAVGTISVNQAAVSFSYQLGGSAPAAQNLTLSSAQSTAYTVTLGSSGCSWLQQPANGTSPGTLALTPNPNASALPAAPGSYSCTVTITPASGPAITVTATLTVTAAPSVTATPSPINLVYQIGGATGGTNSASATLTLTNPGTQPLFYLISPVPSNWLAVNQNQGTIPANGSVQVTVSYLTTANLAANTYTGSLAIYVPGAATPQMNVPVNLLVSNSPLLSTATSTLAFTYQVGQQIPNPQNVTVTTTAASGQTPLVLTATAASGGNWLSVPQTAQTGTAFAVSLNSSVVASLAPGTYNGTVSIVGVGSANATASAPLTIPVTLKVSNDPLMIVTFGGCSQGLVSGLTCPMNFPYQVNQNNPTSQTVTVTSSTGAALTITPTASSSASNPAACGTGWLTVGQVGSGTNNSSTFAVSVSPTNIPNGTVCMGTVSVAAVNPASGNASPNSPVAIPVALYVNNSAMLVVNPIALNVSIALNATAFPTLTVTSTDGTGVSFAASSPSGPSWLLLDTSTHNTSGNNTVSMVVNSSGLNPGTYTGSITITAAGSGVLDSPITVPVTLTVAGPAMSISSNALTFNQTLGAAVPAPQSFTVSTSGGNGASITFTTSVAMQQGAGWLNASSGGTAAPGTPATVQVSVNGSGLAAGTYNGTVTVTSTTAGVTGSPATVNVALVVAPGTLSVSTNTLTFTEVQGGTAQTLPVTVSGNPGALNFTATAGSNAPWLGVSVTSGTTPATLQISANPSGLQPGSYTGTVTIASTGATGSPQTVNVALMVVQAQTFTVSPSTLTFTYIVGTQTTLQAQTAQLAASGGVANFTATPSASWLQVSPSSGITPATLTVSIAPLGLGSGSYTGSIAITSPSSASATAASINVNLTVQSVPKPAFTSVANAASYVAGAVAPGENIVIFGSGLGPATLTMGTYVNGSLSTTVANTQVLFDGTAAPILYASAGQTSVMVPYGLNGRPNTNIVVQYQGVQSNPLTYNVVSSTPGIYTANQSGSGLAVMLDYDSKGNYIGLNSAGNPAAKGSTVMVYITGEGEAPGAQDGVVAPTNGSGLYKPLQPVTATVGDIPATVQYYGSAPGVIYGVTQVNVQVPANAPSGPNVPIVITVGNNSTQTGSSQVTMAIQ